MGGVNNSDLVNSNKKLYIKIDDQALNSRLEAADCVAWCLKEGGASRTVRE